MKMPVLLLVGAEAALVTSGVLFAAFQNLWNTLFGVGCVLAALAIVAWLLRAPRDFSRDDDRIVGIGTVCDEPEITAGERQVAIEVTSVDGETFVGRLAHHDGDPVSSWLRPGTVLPVAFDPDAPERLSLADDMLAVRAGELVAG
jgi:hypothetical protein